MPSGCFVTMGPSIWGCRGRLRRVNSFWLYQILSDLVVNSQAIDNADFTFLLIWRRTFVQAPCRHRVLRCATLSPSQLHRFTTKVDRIWSIRQSLWVWIVGINHDIQISNTTNYLNGTGGPISGVFTGPAAPIVITIEFPNGFKNGLASRFQLFVIQMFPDGSISAPVIRSNVSLV